MLYFEDCYGQVDAWAAQEKYAEHKGKRYEYWNDIKKSLMEERISLQEELQKSSWDARYCADQI